MNQKEPNILSAKELHSWLERADKEPVLIDVRESNEILIAPFPYKVLHLPLSESSKWLEKLTELLPSQKPLVVICHAGIRSLHFCNWLINEGWNNDIFNLEGGIDAWSLDIDPSVPRY